MIRERFRIHREVKIKTAQGRLTAAILIALPIGMLLLMRVMNPTYVQVLFDDPLGVKMLVGAGILQFIGAGILWRSCGSRCDGEGGEMPGVAIITFVSILLILLALVYAFSPRKRALRRGSSS